MAHRLLAARDAALVDDVRLRLRVHAHGFYYLFKYIRMTERYWMTITHVVFVASLSLTWLILTLQHQSNTADALGSVLQKLLAIQLNCSEL